MFFRKKIPILFITTSPLNHKQSNVENYSLLPQNQFVVWPVLICVLFIGLIVSQISSTYSIYIQTSFPTLGIKAVSILLIINSLLVVLFEAPLGNYFKNHNKILMVGIGAFLIGFGMFMLNFSFTFIFAMLACVIYTFGEILFFCMAQLVCYQKGQEKRKGHHLGLYRTVYATSRVIGPTTGSYIYFRFNGHIVWYLSGIIGMLCLIMCNYYKKYD